MNTIADLRERLDEILWRRNLNGLPRARRFGLYVLRVGFAIGRDIGEGQLTLRAMSLVYTTLLSLVPLLAISFSVLKGFGVHNQIEPLLLNLLSPLGEKGAEITGQIIAFVENVKVGVLGGLGFALLFYTVVSLMQKIERAFNYIWHVERERTWSQRFRDYLSVIIVGPVLVFTGVGLMASAMSTPVYETVAGFGPLAALIELVTRVVPYVLIIVAFTFVNIFVPNTGVRFRSALVGGVVAGLLWHTTGWLFASFVASSTNYAAIYSTFATLIIFLIWVYVGWLIMLIGAAIAFYDQYPDQIATPHDRPALSNRAKEKLCLLAAVIIARDFLAEREPPSHEDLSPLLDVPAAASDQVLGILEDAGIVTRNAAEPPGYIPARPLDRVSVHQVIEAARGAHESRRLKLSRLPSDAAVDGVLAEVAGALERVTGGLTLQELASRTTAEESDARNAAAAPTSLGAV